MQKQQNYTIRNYALLRLSAILFYNIEPVHRASKSPTCGPSIFFGGTETVLTIPYYTFYFTNSSMYFQFTTALYSQEK